MQKLDTEIYALKGELEAKPAEIKALESSFEQMKKQLGELEKACLDLQKVRKDKELELAVKEEGIKKLQTQLYSLKTNKEYQTMLQQIQDAKADASLAEDKILEAMDKMELSKVEIDKENKRLKVEEQAFSAEKKEIEGRIKEIDGRLEQLEAQRRQVTPNIDRKVLSQYERILASRDGLAIVAVRDNSCKGCNMFVPPQVINLIRMYERIITCEVCNRMLFIPDDSA